MTLVEEEEVMMKKAKAKEPLVRQLEVLPKTREEVLKMLDRQALARLETRRELAAVARKAANEARRKWIQQQKNIGNKL